MPKIITTINIMKNSRRLRYKLFVRFLAIFTLVLLIYTLIWLGITQNLLNLPTKDAQQLMPHIKTYAGYLFVAALILASLLSLTITDSIINSFEKLKEGFSNFHSGNTDFQIDVTGEDDIEELSRSLNKMVGDLHTAQVKLTEEKDAMQKERETEQKAFLAQQEKLRQEITEKESQMNQNLVREKEKVNYGLFVEKEKMTAVLSHIADALLMLNKNRQIILINKQAEDLLGYTSSEVINKPITEIMKLFEKDREMPLDEYTPHQATTDGKADAFIKKAVRLENTKNTTRFVNIVTVKTNFHQQEDSGYLIFLHSIADEKEQEKKTIKFAATVANELRQPLGMMTQCFRFLTQSDPAVSDEDKRAYLTAIQNAINQLTLFMENMLTVSRIEEGAVNLNIQTIDLTPLVRQTITEIAPQAAAKNITLNFEEPKEAMTVTGDQSTITTVLINLLENATKFNQDAGTITVQIRLLGEEIFVEVQDTGSGIPKEAINNLFKKFSTISNPNTPNEEGTGLGLYICKSLIELQKGKIWMDSVETKGSTFSFSLPKAN